MEETKTVDENNEKVQMILRQTNYSEEQAREKLKEFELNEIDVVKDYLGITVKKAPTPITSINQAIYRQLRSHLDGAMKDYRARVDK